MKTKTVKALDAIAVFTILTILGLAAFASATSLSTSEEYKPKNAVYEVTKLADDSDSNKLSESNEKSDFIPSATERNSSVPSWESSVQISIYPEEQNTQNGKASYKIVVTDNHGDFQEEECTKNYCTTQSYEYELEFSASSDLKGSFESETLFLAPGESKSLELKVSAKQEGIHPFVVRVIGRDSDAKAKAVLVYSYEPPPSNELVKVSINPGRQHSEDGTAEYKIVVTDFHKEAITECDEETCSTMLFKYELEFYSSQDIRGEFETKTIFLEAGDSKSVSLTVNAENEGWFVFSVSAKGTDAGSRAKGLLVVGSENPPQEGIYFQGEGFITGSAGQGALTTINLLNKGGALSGKMSLDNRPYKVEGSLEDKEIKLKVSSPNGEPYGSFEGEVENYDSFLLLRGKLVIGSDALEVWELTAFSKLQTTFIEITPSTESEKPVEAVTRMNEVVSVTKEESTEFSGVASDNEQIYVQPKEITKDKILGFIPTGKQVLVVSVFNSDGEISEEKIREYGSTEVGDYSISVGSLQDESSISIGVAEKSK